MTACIISGMIISWRFNKKLAGLDLTEEAFTQLLPSEGFYIYFSGNKQKQVIFQNPNSVISWFDWLDFMAG